jgi:hypothetical protein
MPLAISTIRLILIATVLTIVGSIAPAQSYGEIALEFRDDVAGTFNDISGTGNFVNLSDDGETTRFSSFLGRNIRIGNNGAVALASSGNLSWLNTGLPSSRVFGGNVEAFLPFWDDLDSESGGVYWQDVGDRLVVQWDDLNHYPGTNVNEGITFQAQIFKSAVDAVDGDIVAQFIYTDTAFAASQSVWDNGASATVGYQGTTYDSMTWSINQAVLSSGTVITLRAVIPEPSSLWMMGIAGLFLAKRRRQV